MVPQLFRGRVGRLWCGMQLALTHLPLPIVPVLPARQEQWLWRLSRGRDPSTPAWILHICSSHEFVVETSGVVGPEALNFLQDLGKLLRRATEEAKSRHYLLQRLSVAVQRGMLLLCWDQLVVR